MKQTNERRFNLTAALFGAFYYCYVGLWKKGMLLYSLTLILSGIFRWIFQIPAPTSSVTSAILSFIFNIFLYGFLANTDLNRKILFDEVIWKEVPQIFQNKWIVISLTIASIAFYVWVIMTTFVGSF